MRRIRRRRRTGLIAAVAVVPTLLAAPRVSAQETCAPPDTTLPADTAVHSFVGRVIRGGLMLNRSAWPMWIMPKDGMAPYGLDLRGPPGHVYVEVHPRCGAAVGETVRVTYRAAPTVDGLPLVLSVSPARPPVRADADTLNGYQRLWAGHQAVNDGRWDDALYYYRNALQHGSRFAGLQVLIDAVRHRAQMGAIAPPDTQRIGAIYIVGIRHVARDGSHHLDNDIAPEQQRQWHLYLGVMRMLVEAFSGGKWTLSIDELAAIATVEEGDTLKPANPDHLGLGRFFFAHAAMRDSDYDTYITFSNTRSPSLGLARRYPFIEGVLYGPPRGMAAVSKPALMLVMHEFFHTIEWSAHIHPAHGFRAGIRKSFPDWHGTSELDYYRWHFRNTLPKVGWRRLDERTRWVLTTASRAAYDHIAAVYDTIPLVVRQRAHALALEGHALESHDTAGAESAYERALAMSPYELTALEGLSAIRQREGRVAEARVLERRLEEARSVFDFLDVDNEG